MPRNPHSRGDRVTRAASTAPQPPSPRTLPTFDVKARKGDAPGLTVELGYGEMSSSAVAAVMARRSQVSSWGQVGAGEDLLADGLGHWRSSYVEHGERCLSLPSKQGAEVVHFRTALV